MCLVESGGGGGGVPSPPCPCSVDQRTPKLTLSCQMPTSGNNRA